VKSVYAEALGAARPRVVSWDVPNGFFTPDMIPPGLEGAASHTVLLVTLGSKLDDVIASRFASGSPFEAVLFDAWGSEAAEALTQAMDSLLREERAERFRGTFRFAPGYGDFSVVNNARWLERVDGAPRGGLPVTADPRTGVLSPRKSILCMIGWYKKEHD